MSRFMKVLVPLGVGAAGIAVAAGYSPFPGSSKSHQALDPDRSIPFPLRSVTRLSHDTSRFRFALPTEEHFLGLPAASYIIAR